MTKIARLFEEEKNKAIKDKEKEISQKIAQNLLNQGIDIQIIIKATGLTKYQIEELKKKE